MTFSLGGAIASFLLAVLIYFLFEKAIDAFVGDARAKDGFKKLLLVLCLLIAIAGGFFFHLTIQ